MNPWASSRTILKGRKAKVIVKTKDEELDSVEIWLNGRLLHGSYHPSRDRS